MKKILLSILLAGASNVYAQDVTFAVSPGYPPFETTDTAGELVGFDIDFANAICQEMNATCHFKAIPFDALVPSLIRNRGGFDAAISAIDITKDRAKKVAFTQPYYDSSASFIASKGVSDVLSAKTVGVQNGTTFQQYIVAQGKRFQVKSYPNLPDAILDLKSGRIDVLFGDTAVLSDLIHKSPELQFVGNKVTDPKYFGNGFGIALNKSKTALLEQLNKSITAIKESGTYDKIYNKWMAN